MTVQRGWQKVLPFLIGLCAYPAIAFGSLVQYDLATPDDGLLTLDTNTGLEWLHLPLTFGHSFNEVATGYGGYTTQYGFRVASQQAVRQLFADVGAEDGFGGVGNVPGASELLLHLGCAHAVREGIRTRYYTLAVMAPAGANSATSAPEALIHLTFERQMPIAGQTDTGNQGFTDRDNSSVASFLVRSAASPFGPSATQPPTFFPPPVGPFVDPPPVPEPANAVLFLAGLIFLVLMRFRRRQPLDTAGADQHFTPGCT